MNCVLDNLPALTPILLACSVPSLKFQDHRHLDGMIYHHCRLCRLPKEIKLKQQREAKSARLWSPALYIDPLRALGRRLNPQHDPLNDDSASESSYYDESSHGGRLQRIPRSAQPSPLGKPSAPLDASPDGHRPAVNGGVPVAMPMRSPESSVPPRAAQPFSSMSHAPAGAQPSTEDRVQYVPEQLPLQLSRQQDMQASGPAVLTGNSSQQVKPRGAVGISPAQDQRLRPGQVNLQTQQVHDVSSGQAQAHGTGGIGNGPDQSAELGLNGAQNHHPRVTGNSKDAIQTQGTSSMPNGTDQPLTGDLRGQRQARGIISPPTELHGREPQVLTGENHAAKERSLRARRQGTIELAPIAAPPQDRTDQFGQVQTADPSPPTSLLTTMSTDPDGALVQDRVPLALQGSPMMYTNPLMDVPPSPSASFPGSPVPFTPLGVTQPRPGRIEDNQLIGDAALPAAQPLRPALQKPESVFAEPAERPAQPLPQRPVAGHNGPVSLAQPGESTLPYQQPAPAASGPGQGEDAPAPLRKLTTRRREVMRQVFEEWRELSTAAATHAFYPGLRGARSRHGELFLVWTQLT